MIDQISKTKLENILSRDPIELTEEEIGFLNARRTYLTSEHKRIFAKVLIKEDTNKKEEELKKDLEQIKNNTPTIEQSAVVEENKQVTSSIADEHNADPDYQPAK